MAADALEEAKATLAHLLNGCKDDMDGIIAKKSLVESFMVTCPQNLTEIMASLHANSALTIDGRTLIKTVTWKAVPAKTNAKARDEAGHAGLFLCSALSAVGEGGDTAMLVVEQYIDANPQVDVVDLLRFVNERGYMEVSDEVMLTSDVANWRKPPPKKKALPAWTKAWKAISTPAGPSGAPTYVNVHDARGRKASIAFLGAVDLEGGVPQLAVPEEIFDVWKLPRPTMLVNVDAGSMHPRQTDEVNMLHNLPNFCDWVEAATGKSGEAELKKAINEFNGIDEKEDLEAGGTGVAAVSSNWSKLKGAGGGLNLRTKNFITIQELMRRSIAEWQTDLKPNDTDKSMGSESSINTLIFTKLTEVFSALLDAVKLNESWILVDRTAGQGSATAEFLLEKALDSGAVRPTIVAIDSLERLGSAREGCNSGRIMKQLSDMYDDENAVKMPNGTEKELTVDFMYELKSFERAETYHDIPDSKMPFPVLPDHQRVAFNNTCDPNRKWRYFYLDGLFSAATHYIIKSNDSDELNMDNVAPQGYLYAHGDSRTYRRLSSNIQQGRSIVMLHNSGGVVTAFSWLQRVFAHQRPSPEMNRLRAPLKFLIANLSKANWTHDFGVSEMIMMKGLADRAPQLFRKHVVSVDILTNTEEQVLETITGCFSNAGAGGVPELGLGNAESNVVYNAWNLHCTLCLNAKKFNRWSKVAQFIVWALAILTTSVAISITSLTGGSMQGLITDAAAQTELLDALELSVLLLPVGTALVTTIVSKLLWRDKWSVCLMAGSQIAAEIYKFRMGALEYDTRGMMKPIVEGEDAPKPMSAKEKASRARQLFVDRIQAMYSACLTELSQTGALKSQKKKSYGEDLHPSRTKVEDKLTLAQWIKIKVWTEKFFYKTKWALPSDSFQTWLAGLRPYLHGPSMREEIKGVIEGLVSEDKIVLMGVPLGDTDSDLIRYTVAETIGLKAKALDAQKDEIRKIQREIVAQLWKEMNHSGADVDGASSAGAVAARGSAKVAPSQDDDEDEVFSDGIMAMRKQIMELQGVKFGNKDAQALKDEKKNRKKTVVTKEVEDDYLCGPLSVESYVVFRVRPIAEKLEKHTTKIARRLQMCDMAGFIFNSTGTILAAVSLTEWVSLTVAVVSVLASVVEFSKLREQVVSSNLALRDIQSLLVEWDSYSVVKRRTPSVKAKIVETTEEALISVVVAHTTAASETQISVKRKLAQDGEDDEDEAS